MPKPHRLAECNYRGQVRVFFTCLTQDRHRAFEQPLVCEFVISELFAEAKSQQCEIPAYCFMPEHGHFLLVGKSRESQLLTAVTRWKQATGYWHAQHAHRRLWTKNFRDDVLRDPDDARNISLYIVSDPLRSGLVTRLEDYLWWGSEWWDRAQLATDCATAGFSRRPPVGID
jgi:REP-associated tyrosine transposase